MLFETEACIDPKSLIVEISLGTLAAAGTYGVRKYENVLKFLGHGGPVLQQIDIWVGAGRAEDSKLAWRSPTNTGLCMGPPASLQ